jgi:hypothetical protein
VTAAAFAPILHRAPKPELTLGLQAIAWAEKYLKQPDGPHAGEPWRFTSEQKSFLIRFYAVDHRGRFIWRRAVLRRAKGWGKSPFLAALCLIEFLGPCRFGGWSAGNRYDVNSAVIPVGHPVAVPVTMPWVQIAGVSETQTANTFTMVLGMIGESPELSEDYPSLDVGLTRLYVAGGGRMVPITASAATAEGARPTFVVMDETHHWKESNGGHKLAAVIRRNLGKSRDGSARAIETTNAHAMGEASTAEASYEAWQTELRTPHFGVSILYDSREAPKVDLVDRDAVMACLAGVYGDSTEWLDLERILGEIYDPDTSAAQARRFYLNQIAASEDAWIEPTDWTALASPDVHLAEGEEITLGFDGSMSDDHCALIGTRVSDGAWITFGVWDPAAYGGEAPRDEIDAMVQSVKDRYDVVAFYSDVHPWESYVDKWAADFSGKRGRSTRSALCLTASAKHAIGWDMRTRTKEITLATERLHRQIQDGTFRHDGHPVVAQHFANARRRPNAWGTSIGKESRESPLKIDSVPAGILSRLAWLDYTQLPPNRKRRRRTGGVAL